MSLLFKFTSLFVLGFVVAAYSPIQPESTLLSQEGLIASRALVDTLRTFSIDSLKASEQHDLIVFRQHEKLARDLYAVATQRWNYQAFAQAATAKQSHMDAILRLLHRHNLPDPIVSKPLGSFRDSSIKKHFDSCALILKKSLKDALATAHDLETEHLVALDSCLSHTSAKDLRLVYQTLRLAGTSQKQAFEQVLKRGK